MKNINNMVKCKCGHVFYSGHCECPMCKLDREEKEDNQNKKGE